MKADTEKTSKRRTSEQVKADAEQQERAMEQAKKDTEKAVSNAASVEDSLRREDLARKNPRNRRLEATPSFTPTPLEKRDEAANSGMKLIYYFVTLVSSNLIQLCLARQHKQYRSQE